MQAATSHAVLRSNEATGPEIDIAGVADFGRPFGGINERQKINTRELHVYADAGQARLEGGRERESRGIKANAPDGFGGVYVFATLADFLAGRPTSFARPLARRRWIFR